MAIQRGRTKRLLIALAVSLPVIVWLVTPPTTESPSPNKAAGAVEEADLEHTRLLEKERNRSDALMRDVALLRSEFDAARTAAAEAAKTKEALAVAQKLALDQEREKSGMLEQQMKDAQKQINALRDDVHDARNEATRVAQAIERMEAEQQRALAEERDRVEFLSAALASTKAAFDSDNSRTAAPVFRKSSKLEAVPELETAKEDIASPKEERPEGARNLAPSEPTDAEIAGVAEEQKLLARADALLQQADIGGARRFLEHALALGSSRAAFSLAETYDPIVLRSWGVRGVSSDLDRARKLYRRAQESGIETAKERLEALN